MTITTRGIVEKAVRVRPRPLSQLGSKPGCAMHSVLSWSRSRFLGLLRAKTRLSTASSDGVKALYACINSAPPASGGEPRRAEAVGIQLPMPGNRRLCKRDCPARPNAGWTECSGSFGEAKIIGQEPEARRRIRHVRLAGVRSSQQLGPRSESWM